MKLFLALVLLTLGVLGFAYWGSVVAFLGVAVAFLATMFVFGSFWFWILVVAGALLVVYFIDGVDDRNGESDPFYVSGATITLLVVLLILQFLSDVRPFTYVYHHPLSALLFVLGYLIAGVLWSFVKWYSYLRNWSDKYKREKAEYFARPKNDSPDGRDYWNRLHRGTLPTAKENKSRIIAWMSYWPWSLIWTFINDPIKRAFRALYRELQQTYQRIADKVLADVKTDLEELTKLEKEELTRKDTDRSSL